MSDLLKNISEQRLRAWESAKAILDAADAEGRSLEATEESAWQAANAHIAKLDERAKEIIDAEERAAAIETSLAKFPASKPAEQAAVSEAETLRSFLNGEGRRSLEVRDITKGSTGAPVPTSFYSQLVKHMVQVGPMYDLATKITTSSGENLQVPRTTAFSTAAITTEGSAISESDPTFGAFITLGAYKLSFVTQLSREMITDSGVDITGFLAEQTGVAMGVAANTYFTVGTGSSQPNGIVTASTLGVTGSASVVGVFSADNLIDLVYSVNASYRRQPGCAFQMRDTSIAATRKLKDSQNRYLFEPSLQAGQPDNLLGFPLYSNPDVAATALSAKSVIFGVAPKYYVRQVGGVELARSDDFAFNTDQVTFRATFRVDGNLVDQTGAVKHFIGNAA